MVFQMTETRPRPPSATALAPLTLGADPRSSEYSAERSLSPFLTRLRSLDTSEEVLRPECWEAAAP